MKNGDLRISTENNAFGGMPEAFLFDLNGTMIDDMRYHQKAWYKIVHDELGSPISLEGVKKQMYGKNEDLLFRVFPDRKFTSEELDAISERKEVYYKEAYRPHLAFIPGLANFLQKAERHHISMAIGSAAVPGNIDFILDNLDGRKYFKAIVSAKDVELSKPHPDTFLKAAALLRANPTQCVVFEDAPKGVESARNAGMKSIVLTTLHQPDEFSQYDNVLMFVSDYTDMRLDALFADN